MRFVIYFITLLFLSGCQTSYYQGPPSDHFDGKRFFYPGEKYVKRNLSYDLVSLWAAIIQNPWPKTLPSVSYLSLPSYPNYSKVTFINHSTVLFQTKTINLIFDPIYSYRASPSQLIGPARVQDPGIDFNALPPIDVVMISHNHYDHLDINTLKRLNKAFHPLFIVPLGNKPLLKRYGLQNVVELDWWQKVKVKNATITFLPAHHDSRRWLFDTNRTLWGSYGVQIGRKKIYFAGDTAYANHFKLIRKKWGQPDFSFLPIGAYEPRALLKYYHMNPRDAVQAHRDLQSRISLGIHWGTFQLSSEGFDQPAKDLITASLQAGVSKYEFFVAPEGEPITLSPD